ncbi:sugar kinase [Chelatococcus composti]|jgi:2-dehydro-3-deoxygluconokinase|uniref:2-dehydro-3-deoxygluconokinase n=1 Tax=Chelatococcus composti TaxID=1743235 RepID=A0A841KGG6_9HYPH|nr:sugar kinase [Chelatococcus composti]MBB6168339.1 2-dehydro-3-deoxygluconokinase [Chelatococcus composti]MBS7736578.1 sugar kinase [Chelatococcus composti]GGG39260.1 2-dehydro-3-deoxygluconokinase [Chelatococcus composti]
MAAFDILAFGEPLMEFAQLDDTRRHYLPGFGGDTSNVAIAAARLGAKTAVFTAVGDDSFGRDFLKLWDEEGVDRSSVITMPGERTGIYFISYGPNGHEFSYYRAGSAASLVTPSLLPLDLIGSSRVLHLSGISQAISVSACDACFAAVRHAREKGVVVSYDTNLRLRLWPLDRARAVINATAQLADIVLPGLDDARQLTGLDRPEDICDFYLKGGARVVALTLGKDGTMVAVPGERRLIPGRPVKAVDATGAGDTFDGGFLVEWLRSGDPFAAAAYGNAAAALSTLGHGAVAPMPRAADVATFMAQG